MSASRPYHHGSLPDALLAAGLAMLAEEDAAGLSLRALARRVGVSPPSVYRHFADKDALLTALAAEGLKRMADIQRAAAAGRDARSALAATGRAYVQFAIDHPALFRLIFASAIGRGQVEQAEAFRILHEHAGATLPQGADREAAVDAALRAWTRAHGLAMLIIDGLIAADDRIIDAVLADGASAPQRAVPPDRASRGAREK